MAVCTLTRSTEAPARSNPSAMHPHRIRLREREGLAIRSRVAGGGTRMRPTRPPHGSKRNPFDERTTRSATKTDDNAIHLMRARRLKPVENAGDPSR